MTQARKNRSLKKLQGQSMEKKTATKVGKKVKKTPKPKKARKSPEFIDLSDKEEESPQVDKGKIIPPLLRMEEEVQSFFYLRKESKNLTIKK